MDRTAPRSLEELSRLIAEAPPSVPGAGKREARAAFLADLTRVRQLVSPESPR